MTYSQIKMILVRNLQSMADQHVWTHCQGHGAVAGSGMQCMVCSADGEAVLLACSETVQGPWKAMPAMQCVVTVSE